MICLACGDCCKRMSPLTSSEQEPCPYLDMRGDIAHCINYQKRPYECAMHTFHTCIYCPVGKDVLKLNTEKELNDRLYLVREDRGEFA